MLELITPPQTVNNAGRRSRADARISKRKWRELLLDTSRISQYYSQTIDDYRRWSPEGYMHFGLWKRWRNPLDRRGMLQAMNDMVFDALQLDRLPAARIADLGCGLGAVSCYGATRFPQHRWLGYTLCEEQIAFGRARQNPCKVRLQKADFHSLPLDSCSVDAAFFLESLTHSQRPEVALREAARVLRPGGRLIIVDGLLRRPLTAASQTFQRLHKAVCSSWALPAFHELQRLQVAARLAGLQIEEERELGWQIAPCVAHTPLLVLTHAIRLARRGQWSGWKRKHLIGCLGGVVLGLHRRNFGYYRLNLKKPESFESC